VTRWPGVGTGVEERSRSGAQDEGFAEALEQTPIPGSFSCDSPAYQAKEAGLFVRGADIEKENVLWTDLGTSQIFLVRQTSTD
jgi:hypothetical protein